MIKAGTIWTHDATGETVEFLRDAKMGTPVTVDLWLFNGQHPKPLSPLPRWMKCPERGTLPSTPPWPPGVTVKEPGS